MSRDRDAPTTVAPGTVTDFLLRLVRGPAGPGAPMPTLRPGQVIGRYLVVREIGRGGFGVIYEAHDQELPRSVALKVLRRGGDADPGNTRLRREAEAAAQLAHPNIVTFHDLGHFGDVPYLVLELLHGRTLERRLTEGAVPTGEAVRIAVEVSRGLAHAHARGVIHRDLSPANVFLCDDGHVKLLDFGMAHALGHRKVDGGTRAYMAPEQARGAPEDERTDVFALGVILYQMVAGRLPVPVADPARPAADVPLEVPGWPVLGPLLARMLAQDPIARPRTGQEVADLLLALTRETEHPPGPTAQVPGHRVRPRSLGLVLAAGTLLAGAPLAWWLSGRTATGSTPGELVGPSAEPPRPVPPHPTEVQPEPPRPPQPAPAPRHTGAPELGRVLDCTDTIYAVSTPARASGEGVLTVEADPFGEVFVNGVSRGDAPRECRVTAGTLQVRVVHPTHGAVRWSVLVPAGERRRRVAEFAAPPR